ncbi:hypothetical protein [Cupriavidus taiwanensis]|uniref:Uncharacterized protein n=1 Tax=Cupriavidus taiwanensis TaxID=164546 RepID=A0A375BWQ1_9BURK|nr:hypothetical protein CBM2587_A80009 [Cupriavidus taiwanensis]
MSYILLWVTFNPVYLGEYASREACNAARVAVASAASASYTAVAPSVTAGIASLPFGKKMDIDTSPEATEKIMLCVPKG